MWSVLTIALIVSAVVVAAAGVGVGIYFGTKGSSDSGTTATLTAVDSNPDDPDVPTTPVEYANYTVYGVLCENGGTSCTVINVEDSKIAGTFTLPQAFYRGHVIPERDLLVAAFPKSLEFFELSELTNIKSVGSFTFPNSATFQLLEISVHSIFRLAVLARLNGVPVLQWYDIENPANTLLLQQVAVTVPDPFTIWAMTNRICIFDTHANIEIQVYDINAQQQLVEGDSMPMDPFAPDSTQVKVVFKAAEIERLIVAVTTSTNATNLYDVDWRTALFGTLKITNAAPFSADQAILNIYDDDSVFMTQTSNTLGKIHVFSISSRLSSDLPLEGTAPQLLFGKQKTQAFTLNTDGVHMNTFARNSQGAYEHQALVSLPITIKNSTFSMLPWDRSQ